MKRNVDDVVSNIVDQVRWWYDIGKIRYIDDTDAIEEAIDSLYPEGLTDEESDNLIFRVKMAI